MPAPDEGRPWAWRLAVIAGGPGWIMVDRFKLLAASFLAYGALRRLTWRARRLAPAPARPAKQALLHDEDEAARLAGYLVARVASRAPTQSTDGVVERHLTFDH